MPDYNIKLWDTRDIEFTFHISLYCTKDSTNESVPSEVFKTMRQGF